MNKVIVYPAKDNELKAIYRKIEPFFESYLFKFEVRKENFVFYQFEEFEISSENVKEKIRLVLTKESPHEYMYNIIAQIEFYCEDNIYKFRYSPQIGIYYIYELNSHSLNLLLGAFAD